MIELEIITAKDGIDRPPRGVIFKVPASDDQRIMENLSAVRLLGDVGVPSVAHYIDGEDWNQITITIKKID